MRHGLLCAHPTLAHSSSFSSSSHSLNVVRARSLLYLPLLFPSSSPLVSISRSIMPQRKGGSRGKMWKPKTNDGGASTSGQVTTAAAAAESVTNGVAGLNIAESSRQSHVSASPLPFGAVQLANQGSVQGQNSIWKPKSYGTVGGAATAEVVAVPSNETAGEFQSSLSKTIAAPKTCTGLSQLFRGNLLENFSVDNYTYSRAQIRATFYPKFENEKSDQEIRIRMIEMVSKGLATLEVTRVEHMPKIALGMCKLTISYFFDLSTFAFIKLTFPFILQFCYF
uniref:Uncharacterized protein MANES_11G141000 n=1 Tax=Rhizophora mucronata TaxID=61149 RepID=A0A2P2M248_RHIMU